MSSNTKNSITILFLQLLTTATAAGCRFVLVRTGNGRESEAALSQRGDLAVHDDLASFAAWFVENTQCLRD